MMTDCDKMPNGRSDGMTAANTKERFAQDSLSEIGLQILIRPGIAPKQRHLIEDALMEAGCEVVGGGTINDGTESDISLFVDSVRNRLPNIMLILQEANIGAESVVGQTLPSEVWYSVYGDAQSWMAKIPHEHSHKPWWKFWKK